MLSDAVRAIISRLQSHGYQAYAVGGCVRDLLMRRIPKDWDVCTSAKPEETIACFGNERVVTTGLQHGTVTVLIDRQPIEVTTFRIESGYSDGRHPDNVCFTTHLREDLSRRDFTMNAMAMDINGIITDPYDGHTDIHQKMIRCVGYPDARFAEDGLRILRALRFASELDFYIEPHTAFSIHDGKKQLSRIAAERITAEMTKLLAGIGAADILTAFHDVLCVFIPELSCLADFEQHSPYHCHDVWTHTAHAVHAAKKDPAVLWAVLLHDIGKPEKFHKDAKGIGHFYGHAHSGALMAADILMRLKMEKRTIWQVTELIAYHDRLMPDKYAVKQCLNAIGPALFEKLLDVMEADNAAKAPEKRAEGQIENRHLRAMYTDVMQNNECYDLRHLTINGDDLISLGFQNQAVGTALNTLLKSVMRGKTINTREALLKQAKGLQRRRTVTDRI